MSRVCLALFFFFCSASLTPCPVSAQDVQDPMRPPEVVSPPAVEEQTPAAELPTLTLEATMIRGERRNAVINGMTVGIGDTLSGARIVRIEPGNVLLLTDQSELMVLRFAPDGMLVPAKTAQ